MNKTSSSLQNSLMRSKGYKKPHKLFIKPKELYEEDIEVAILSKNYEENSDSVITIIDNSLLESMKDIEFHLKLMREQYQDFLITMFGNKSIEECPELNLHEKNENYCILCGLGYF